MRIVKRIAKPRIKEFSQFRFYTPELIECVKENEIIKALDCLKGYEVLCDGCLYQMRGYAKCRENVASDALDLINRQKAEIEQLKHKYELAVAEREANVKGFTETISTAKTEAIKEFAERLKEEFHVDTQKYNENTNSFIRILTSTIDVLVKEMTEKGGEADARR